MKVNLLDGSVRRTYEQLCRTAETPLARNALNLLKEEDWEGLVSMKVDPTDYDNPARYLLDCQIASFFKKYKDWDLGLDPQQKAIDTFFDCERQCLRSNVRLTPLIQNLSVYGEVVENVVRRTQEKIAEMLGPCPDVHQFSGRFGPGSTFCTVSGLVTVPDKMSNEATFTNRVLTVFGKEWDSTAWAKYGSAVFPVHSAYVGDSHSRRLNQQLYDEEWISVNKTYAPRPVKGVPGNRFTTVDKTAKTRRGICIEPSINVYYQLAVGSYLTNRLKRTRGWDKSVIQDHHRYLAQIGSAMGHLATIDLSNASDTVSKALVKLLLPVDWFNLLDSIRSSQTLINGSWVCLEKFSSMGNGFTFELETLIFRAITEVSLDLCELEGEIPDEFYGRSVSTFGDDIICPTSCASDVQLLLDFFGFTVNKEKSFTSGRFRESCGGDFFDGKAVRPHYLKEDPNEPHKQIALANGIRRLRDRYFNCSGRDDLFTVWLRSLSGIPNSIRGLRGPAELGDLVIHDDPDTWKPVVRRSVRYFRVWRPVRWKPTDYQHFRPGVVYAYALYTLSEDRRTNLFLTDSSIAVSGADTRVSGSYVSGYRFGRVAYS